MSLFRDKVEITLEEAELLGQKALLGFNAPIKILLAVLALAIIPAYFISKYVSQKIYARKYQTELIAAKSSFVSPLPPEVSEKKVIPQGDGIYSAIAKISNPNLDLSFSNVTYKFNFYNQQRQLIYSYPEKIPDKLFLLPNQTKYISVPRFSSAEQIEYVDFELPAELPWQKRLSIPKVEFTIPTPSKYQQFSPPAYVVEGQFINNSAYALKKARLTFLLFDADNKIIGSSQRDEETIKPFERRAYKQLWPGLPANELTRVEVFADTNTLDATNLSASTPSAGNAGDLGRPSGQ